VNTVSGLRGRIALKEMNRRKNEAEYRQVISGELIREQMENMQAAFRSGDPGQMMATFQNAIQTAVQAFSQQDPPMPEDARSISRSELMQGAYNVYVGTFLEKNDRGFVLWDFQSLVADAKAIDFDREQGSITIHSPGDANVLTGATVMPFLRYLAYLGIFMVDEARKPCPECSSKPEPVNCENCGGLGWIVPDPADQGD
jgi:hypothetical protein